MAGFARALKRRLWIASLGFSRAFDKVFHESSFKATMEQGADEALASFLQELRRGRTGQVGASDVFQLFPRVRQGDVL
eukprot:222751-Pyramimonas_sp.AAC.1